MDIRIELNKRLGYGFQLRVMDGPVCEIYDDEPLTMIEALDSAQEAIDAMNEELGTDFMVSKITTGSVDPPDIPGESGVIAFQPQPDVREAVVDGENQPVVSARGVILLAWTAWRKDGSEQSKTAMRRYCEYISAHGYRGGASKAMAELEAMSLNRGVKWIKRTFAKYIRDKVAVMSYVLPQM